MKKAHVVKLSCVVCGKKFTPKVQTHCPVRCYRTDRMRRYRRKIRSKGKS